MTQGFSVLLKGTSAGQMHADEESKLPSGWHQKVLNSRTLTLQTSLFFDLQQAFTITLLKNHMDLKPRSQTVLDAWSSSLLFG